jgi:hypothetical protein
MKNRSVTLCFLTATLFAVPAFAAEQSAEATPPPTASAPGPRPGREEMIKRFDRDGDGQLNDVERQGAREEMRQKWAERGGKRGAMEGKMRKRLDRDGNGRFDRAERHQATKLMRKMHRKMHRQMMHRSHRWGSEHAGRGARGPALGAHRPMRQAMLKRFDQDGDGRLNEGERGEARKAGEAARAKMQERRKQVLSRFDGDGDGRLGESERQAMREAWQKFIEQQPAAKK